MRVMFVLRFARPHINSGTRRRRRLFAEACSSAAHTGSSAPESAASCGRPGRAGPGRGRVLSACNALRIYRRRGNRLSGRTTIDNEAYAGSRASRAAAAASCAAIRFGANEHGSASLNDAHLIHAWPSGLRLPRRETSDRTRCSVQTWPLLC